MTSAIEVRGLTVKLGEFAALQDVDFTLEEGAFLAVLGPNGSGKSTLLRALLGLIPLHSGTATVLGYKPGSCPPQELGYVPQLKTLDRSFPAVAEDLVTSGIRRRWSWHVSPVQRAAALEALAAVGAGALAGRPIGWLSGGELQRVYLARALARRPQLILLDEPAAGVDAAGEADMYHLLEEWRAQHGTTVVMVTHDWGGAFHHATHALVLNRQVVSFGLPADALTDANLRRAFGHAGHDHAMGLKAGRHG